MNINEILIVYTVLIDISKENMTNTLFVYIILISAINYVISAALCIGIYGKKLYFIVEHPIRDSLLSLNE